MVFEKKPVCNILMKDKFLLSLIVQLHQIPIHLFFLLLYSFPVTHRFSQKERHLKSTKSLHSNLKVFCSLFNFLKASFIQAEDYQKQTFIDPFPKQFFY